jgi:predicted dehydrogenase
MLDKYGYNSMPEFLNWRWYRKYGGGPICDLGSHQIDLFSWVFGTNPRSVVARGGRDYYRDWEWYDNVMAIYEYATPEGKEYFEDFPGRPGQMPTMYRFKWIGPGYFETKMDTGWSPCSQPGCLFQ